LWMNMLSLTHEIAAGCYRINSNVRLRQHLKILNIRMPPVYRGLFQVFPPLQQRDNQPSKASTVPANCSCIDRGMLDLGIQ
jgi:hypothetical protein